MNVTALIDVVFLLIVFFMLVNNIVSEENTPLVPPRLDDAKTVALEDENRIIVNVVPQPFDIARRRPGVDPLNHPGEAAHVRVGINPKRYDLDALDEVTTLLANAHANNPELQVVLRADAAIYFEDIRKVMSAIHAAEIQRVSLTAFLNDDEMTLNDAGGVLP